MVRAIGNIVIFLYVLYSYATVLMIWSTNGPPIEGKGWQSSVWMWGEGGGGTQDTGSLILLLSLPSPYKTYQATTLVALVMQVHRLNMELDLHSLFGLRVQHVLIGGDPAFGLIYEGAIGHCQPR